MDTIARIAGVLGAGVVVRTSLIIDALPGLQAVLGTTALVLAGPAVAVPTFGAYVAETFGTTALETAAISAVRIRAVHRLLLAIPDGLQPLATLVLQAHETLAFREALTGAVLVHQPVTIVIQTVVAQLLGQTHRETLVHFLRDEVARLHALTLDALPEVAAVEAQKGAGLLEFLAVKVVAVAQVRALRPAVREILMQAEAVHAQVAGAGI